MGNMKDEGDGPVEMDVKLWEPYAVQVMARDIDVIARVQTRLLKKINGMTVEQLSPCEVRLHCVPRARGRELYENAPNKARFTFVPDTGHCDLLAKIGPARFREIITALLSN